MSTARRIALFSALGVFASIAFFDGPSAVLAQKEPKKKPAVPAVKVENFDRSAKQFADRLLAEGKQVFRFDTFGSEDFYGGKLKLHNAIQGKKHGGVGDGISPKQALDLGLKVDAEAVPKQVAAGIKNGKVDLNDPANTLALLKANAVVGVKGIFAADGKTLRSIGIQCALCHSTVDDSFTPGIGRRLDGCRVGPGTFTPSPSQIRTGYSRIIRLVPPREGCRLPLYVGFLPLPVDPTQRR